jgi:cyclopropane-fatty-acyl-phospholipid synthase
MHQPITSDTSFDWECDARPTSPPVLRELAEEAGMRFNGDAPWDIRVFDERVYRMILSRGSLGFGEAYMAGLWGCARLDELFLRLLGIDADERLGGGCWNHDLQGAAEAGS